MDLHEHQILKLWSHLLQDPPPVQNFLLPNFWEELCCPFLTATAGTTNILLFLLSQGREEAQQEGQPSQMLLQGSAMFLCCWPASGKSNELTSKPASGKLNELTPKYLLFIHTVSSFSPFSRLWAGCYVGICPTDWIFKLLPHAKLKHASLRADETVTWRGWDVFQDLSGPYFDCQMLENFNHQQGPASLLSPSPSLPPWQEIKSLFQLEVSITPQLLGLIQTLAF